MRKIRLFSICLLTGVLLAGCSFGYHEGGHDTIYGTMPEAESASDSIEAVFHESAPTDESVSADIPDTSVANEAKEESSDTAEPYNGSLPAADELIVGGSENDGAFTTTDWKEFEIAVDGAVVNLPCSYQEFVDKTGYRLEQEDYEQQTLKDDYEVNEWLVSDADPDRSVTVYFYNDSDTIKTYAECQICGIYTYPNKELNGKTYASFDLANGVNGSSTAEQVKETLGEPMRESDIDGVRILRYTVNATGSGGQIEIQFTPDGVMDNFILKTH